MAWRHLRCGIAFQAVGRSGYARRDVYLLDSGFRRNDGIGAWIPAFAGMTAWMPEGASGRAGTTAGHSGESRNPDGMSEGWRSTPDPDRLADNILLGG